MERRGAERGEVKRSEAKRSEAERVSVSVRLEGFDNSRSESGLVGELVHAGLDRDVGKTSLLMDRNLHCRRTEREIGDGGGETASKK